MDETDGVRHSAIDFQTLETLETPALYSLAHKVRDGRFDLCLMILRVDALSSDYSQLIHTRLLAVGDRLVDLLNGLLDKETVEVNSSSRLRLVVFCCQCVALSQQTLEDPSGRAVVEFVLLSLVLLALHTEIMCASAIPASIVSCCYSCTYL